MTGFPRPGHRRLPERVTLTVVGALLALLLAASPGLAQFSSGTRAKQEKNAPVVFQADEDQYDDQRTDTITASVHVSFFDSTGGVFVADFMEVRDSMNNVFAQNVRRLRADR